MARKGKKYTRTVPVPVHPEGAAARVWAIECGKPQMGIARIADQHGPHLAYGAEIRLQVAGATEEEVEYALGWFLKTFPSAEITPYNPGLSEEERKKQRPYVLNPIRLGEALGQPNGIREPHDG